MAKRASIRVEWLKETLNRQLARPELAVETRSLVSVILSDALMETGNYRGFQDLYWRHQGCADWEATGIENTPHTWDVKAPYVHGTADGSDQYLREYS